MHVFMSFQQIHELMKRDIGLGKQSHFLPISSFGWSEQMTTKVEQSVVDKGKYTYVRDSECTH